MNYLASMSLVVALGCLTFVSSQSQWTLRNPLPTSANLRDIVFQNAKFYAIGSAGELLTSSDGNTWTRVFTEAQYSVNSLTWGNGRFVAVGDSGLIVTSASGAVWTVQNSMVTTNLNEVIWSPYDSIKQYIAVGMNGLILASSDAITWTPRISNSNRNIYAICEGYHNFSASSKRDTVLLAIADDSILTSRNGNLWYSSSPGLANSHLRDISWSGTRFVAVGSAGSKGVVITQDTGRGDGTWTVARSDTLKPYSRVMWLGNFFAVFGTGLTLLTSPDATVWTSSSLPSPTVNSIAWGNGLAVAVGDSGQVFTSANFASWTGQSSAVTRVPLTSIAYGANRYIAVGDTVMLSSTDGVNWQQETNANRYRFSKVAAHDSLFVVLATRAMLTSVDGTTWNSFNTSSAATPSDVAFGANETVVAAGPSIFVNTVRNPPLWNPSEKPVDGLNNQRELYLVAWGNNTYVGYGSFPSGYATQYGFLSSIDSCCNWYPRKSIQPMGTEKIADIEWGNGRFVAVGHIQSLGEVYISTDGVNWGDSTSAATPIISSLHWTNNQFIGVGDDTVYSSPNGVIWTAISTHANRALSDIAYGTNQYVAVGSSGTIVSSFLPSSSKFQIQSTPTSRTFTIFHNVLQYYLSAPMLASVRIYDIKGRLIGEPVNGTYQKGYHTTFLPYLTSGSYVASLKTGTDSAVKLFLVK